MIGSTIDQYKITKALGKNPETETFLGVHLQTGKNYILKSVQPELLARKGFREKFLAECVNLIKLEHENVSSLINVLDEDGRLLTVQEYVTGESLAQKLEGVREGVALPNYLNYFKGIIKGLNYAHSQGFTHRFLDPEHILIDTDGTAKVTGFEQLLQKFKEKNRGRTGLVMEAHYFAPERFRNPNTTDPRVNIYSAGVILFQMATGVLPFSESVYEEIYKYHAAGKVPEPSAINADLSSEASTIIRTCLAKKPEQRYQNCEDVLTKVEMIPAPVVAAEPDPRSTQMMPSFTGEDEATGGDFDFSDMGNTAPDKEDSPPDQPHDPAFDSAGVMPTGSSVSDALDFGSSDSQNDFHFGGQMVDINDSASMADAFGEAGSAIDDMSTDASSESGFDFAMDDTPSDASGMEATNVMPEGSQDPGADMFNLEAGAADSGGDDPFNFGGDAAEPAFAFGDDAGGKEPEGESVGIDDFNFPSEEAVGGDELNLGSDPDGDAGGGFDFGSEPASSDGGGFDFGSEPASDAGGGFDFASEPASDDGGGFDFGSEPASDAGGGFDFDSEPEPSSGGFDFGADQPASDGAGFDFGSEETSTAGDDFNFGDEPAAEADGGFDFGSEPAAADSGGFNFGSEPEANASDGFDFGSEPAASDDGGFDFGSEPSTDAGGGFDFDAEPVGDEGGGFDFGADAGSGDDGGFDFGSEAASDGGGFDFDDGGGEFDFNDKTVSGGEGGEPGPDAFDFSDVSLESTRTTVQNDGPALELNNDQDEGDVFTMGGDDPFADMRPDGDSPVDDDPFSDLKEDASPPASSAMTTDDGAFSFENAEDDNDPFAAPLNENLSGMEDNISAMEDAEDYPLNEPQPAKVKRVKKIDKKTLALTAVLAVVVLGVVGFFIINNRIKSNQEETIRAVEQLIDGRRFDEALTRVALVLPDASGSYRNRLNNVKNRAETEKREMAQQIENLMTRATDFSTNGEDLVDGVNDALNAYQTILSLDPNHVEAKAESERIRSASMIRFTELQDSGQELDALSILTSLTRANPKDREAIKLYQDLKNRLRGEQSGELQKRIGDLYARQNYGPAVPLFKELEQIDGGSDFATKMRADLVAALIEQGQNYLSRFKFADAESSYRDALQLDPQNKAVNDALANISSERMKAAINDAKDNLNRAIASNDLKKQYQYAIELDELDPSNQNAPAVIQKVIKALDAKRDTANQLRDVGQFKQVAAIYKEIYEIDGNEQTRELWRRYDRWTPPDRMGFVPGGEFTMGNNRTADARPRHKVVVSSFYMDKFEVSNEEFYNFVKENPAWNINNIEDRFHDGNYLRHWTRGAPKPDDLKRPVTHVSWYAAKAYAAWAKKRLPTEAEWEKAAAGNTSEQKYWWGNFSDAKQAVYEFYPEKKPAPIGTFPANKYGVFEILGNVNEWVEDTYDPGFYSQSGKTDPVNTEAGSVKSLRGGSFQSRGRDLVLWLRYSQDARICHPAIGFRCASDANDVP